MIDRTNMIENYENNVNNDSGLTRDLSNNRGSERMNQYDLTNVDEGCWMECLRSYGSVRSQLFALCLAGCLNLVFEEFVLDSQLQLLLGQCRLAYNHHSFMDL